MGCRRFSLRAALALAWLVVLAAGAAHAVAAGEDFPPYLPHPQSLPADARREVQAIWSRRTLFRASSVEPAPAPLPLYRLFVDLPEVTAAAGQYLNVGHYRVVRTGTEEFDVTDHEGTRGHYRVIRREARQRVLIVRAQRKTRLVGDVSGTTLTVLTLIPETAPDGRPQVAPRLESAVRIEHRVVALIASVLVPMFPRYADRKIGEVFAVAARVSGWAWEKPDEFCAWLGAQPGGARWKETFAVELPACGPPP